MTVSAGPEPSKETPWGLTLKETAFLLAMYPLDAEEERIVELKRFPDAMLRALECAGCHTVTTESVPGNKYRPVYTLTAYGEAIARCYASRSRDEMVKRFHHARSLAPGAQMDMTSDEVMEAIMANTRRRHELEREWIESDREEYEARHA